MSHDHQLPQTYDDVKECAAALLAILTGKQEATWAETAKHVYVVGGLILYWITQLDKRPIIGDGRAIASALTDEQADAINAVLDVSKTGQIKGGPLSTWMIKQLLDEVFEQLMILVANLFRDDDGERTISAIGDGALLKALLENLPQILAAIAAIVQMFAVEDNDE